MQKRTIWIRDLEIGAGIPKIIAPIIGKDRDEVLRQARAILEQPAELLEWRADYYGETVDIPELLEVLAELREILGQRALLFTFHTTTRGGKKNLAAGPYRELLRMVAESRKADLITVEPYVYAGDIRELIREIQQTGTLVVGTECTPEGTPEEQEILRKMCEMQEMGVDIPKFAVTACHREQVLTLLSASSQLKETYADRPFIMISMGGMGSISRICCEEFGSAITFGMVGQASAPGQLPVAELRQILESLHRARGE